YFFELFLKNFILFFQQRKSGRIFVSSKLFNTIGTTFQGVIYVESPYRSCGCRQLISALRKDQGRTVIGVREPGSYDPYDSFVPIFIIDYGSKPFFLLVLPDL